MSGDPTPSELERERRIVELLGRAVGRDAEAEALETPILTQSERREP